VDEMVEDMLEKETLDYKELQDLVLKYYPEGIKSERTGMLADRGIPFSSVLGD